MIAVISRWGQLVSIYVILCRIIGTNRIVTFVRSVDVGVVSMTEDRVVFAPQRFFVVRVGSKSVTVDAMQRHQTEQDHQTDLQKDTRT